MTNRTDKERPSIVELADNPQVQIGPVKKRPNFEDSCNWESSKDMTYNDILEALYDKDARIRLLPERTRNEKIIKYNEMQDTPTILPAFFWMDFNKAGFSADEVNRIFDIAMALLTRKLRSEGKSTYELDPVELKSGKDMEVGEVRSDGTIYLGYMHDKDWFVSSEDMRHEGHLLSTMFNEAADVVKDYQVHGHDDWQMPNDNLLSMMIALRNTGGFKDTFNANQGYWSSTEIPLYPNAKVQVFARMADISDRGFGINTNYRVSDGLVRPVRSEPRVPKL